MDRFENPIHPDGELVDGSSSGGEGKGGEKARHATTALGGPSTDGQSVSKDVHLGSVHRGSPGDNDPRFAEDQKDSEAAWASPQDSEPGSAANSRGAGPSDVQGSRPSEPTAREAPSLPDGGDGSNADSRPYDLLDPAEIGAALKAFPASIVSEGREAAPQATAADSAARTFVELGSGRVQGAEADAVADQPSDVRISVGSERLAPGEAMQVEVGARFVDLDGSEVHSVLVTVPDGVIVLDVAGHDPTGFWTPGADGTGGVVDLSGLTGADGVLAVELRVAVDDGFGADVTMAFSVTATAVESNGGAEATASAVATVQVAAAADPALAASPAAGPEDSAIDLGIAAALGDTDGSETLSVTIEGVPDGASLSAGTDNGDGSWTLTPDQLEGLTITPPADSDADFTLKVTATATETASGDTASRTIDLPVTVDAVADTPSLQTGAGRVMEESFESVDLAAGRWGVYDSLPGWQSDQGAGVEIQDFGDGTRGSQVIELDSHDNSNMYREIETEPGAIYTLSFDYSPRKGVAPDSNGIAVFWNGEKVAEVTGEGRGVGGGRYATQWTTQQVELEGTGGADRLEFRAVGKSDSLGGLLDNITLQDAGVHGVEDSWIPLRIDAALADTDGSESLTVTLSGLPEGALLSAGTENGDGSWTVPGDQLDGLALRPAPHSDADFTIKVTATATEAANGSEASVSEEFLLKVGAVADAPVVEVSDLWLHSGETVLFDIDAALVDTDGSESLSVRIEGLPDGASLSAGVKNADGSWTVPGEALADLEASIPQSTTGLFEIRVLATATEGANGDTATTLGDFALRVTPPPEIVLSNATTRDGEQDQSDSYGIADTGPRSRLVVTGDEMDIGGVADSAKVTISRDGSGNPTVVLDSPWNSVKNVAVQEDGGKRVTVRNFVDTDVTMSDGGDSRVGIYDAKRGSVVTGDGDDSVYVKAYSNDVGGGQYNNQFDISTGAGNDRVRLDGAANGGTTSTVVTGDGDDRIDMRGTSDDTLDAGAGKDSVRAGAGDDVVLVRGDEAEFDDIRGDAGTDTMRNVGGADLVLNRFQANNGIEVVDGDNHAILGNDKNNSLDFRNADLVDVTHVDGGAGNDAIRGSAGDDDLRGGLGNDQVRGEAGNDVIDGAEGNDRLYGDDGNDVVTGGAGNDRVYGGDGNDSLAGGLGDDRLYGDAGNDVITGDAGNDQLHGGDGDDTLDAGAGKDSVRAGAGDDVVLVRGDEAEFDDIRGDAGTDTMRNVGGADLVLNRFQANNRIEVVDGDNHAILGNDKNNSLDFRNADLVDVTHVDGGAGNDAIRGSAGDDDLRGGLGNDQVRGEAGNDVIDGGEGNDRLYGDDGNDVVIGGEGNDRLYGGDGDDILYDPTGNNRLDGNSGNDIVIGGTGNDELRGGDGNDILYAPAGANRLYGDDGDDTVIGGSGNDRAYGGAGDDRLIGGLGNDQLHGGAGDDTLDAGAGKDSVRAGAGDDVVLVRGDEAEFDDIRGDAGTDTMRNVGGADLVLNRFQANNGIEVVDGDNHAILGNDKNNSLDFRNADLVDVTHVDGGAGNDAIRGSAGDDDLRGGLGNDQVRGEAGNDVIDGGEGNDRLYGDDGNDVVTGGAGNDRVYGGDGNDSLAGGLGDDRLYGDAGNDVITGDAGNDQLHGGDGDDIVFDLVGSNRLYGNDGNDIVVGGVGDDLLDGGAGDDILYDLGGTNRLYGRDGNDQIFGGTGNDRAYGGDGDDTLIGRDGDDLLYGEKGNDRLEGGLGDDRAFGGEGDDTYLFGIGDGHDRFDGGSAWTDVIQLKGVTAGPSEGDWTLQLREGNVLAQSDGQIFLSDDAAGTIRLQDGSDLEFTGVETIQW